MKHLLLLLFQLVLLYGIHAFPGESDLVTSLPDLSIKLPFRHYSGYLRLKNDINMHYWFVESQTGHPEKDPVVLHLDGGPGCSSMLGELFENGPIRLNRNSSFSLNPYAFNQKANVLYLESPVGVGFSYRDDHNYVNQTGATTAVMNLDSLREFYRKFPQFAENPFYIHSLSYGGVYAPMFSVQALENKFPKNFKGTAIGNPVLDTWLNLITGLYFYYYHGVIGYGTWKELHKNCCANSTAHTELRYCNDFSPACIQTALKAVKTDFDPNLNRYNLYQKCYKFANQTYEDSSLFQMDQFGHLSGGEYYSSPASVSPPCENSEYMEKYLNRVDVRKALHIDEKAMQFGVCRIDIGYEQVAVSMAPYVKKMVDSGLKVLIYSGDVDSVCSFLEAQWFSEDLGYNTTVEYRPWTYNGEVAGFGKVYDKQFSVITVKGAGHVVPADKPGPALQMFHDFLGVH